MGNPAGWVFRVAVNLGYNRTRRRALEGDGPCRPPGMPWTSRAWRIRRSGGRSRACLLDQRAVVVLRFHLDWSIDAIAEALGCKPGTVKSRLHRGLQRLERMLEVPA